MNKDYSKLTKKELVEECKRKDSEWMGLYEVNKKLKKENEDLNWSKVSLESERDSKDYTIKGQKERIEELERENTINERDAKIEVYESVVNKFFKRRH